MKRPDSSTPVRPSALRRGLYLRRRSLAAVCTFAAVLAALMVLSPTPPATVSVVAAREGLAAGTVLTEELLLRVELPVDAAPDGALTDESDALGRTLAAPLSARSVLTSASTGDGVRLAREGYVVTSLPLGDDGIAALVRPGVRLDVLDASGAVLARDVSVLAAPDATPGSTSLLGTPGGAVRGQVLVEVSAEVASALATASQGGLSVVIH